jgi:hypothetical protein
VDVSICFVVAFLLNTCCNYFPSILARVSRFSYLQKYLSYERLFPILALRKIDWDLCNCARRWFALVKQKLFVKAAASDIFVSENKVSFLFSKFDFLVEVSGFVIYQHPLLVTHVCCPKLFIYFNRVLDRLVLRLFIYDTVELLSPVCGSNQVQNSIIPVVTQHDHVTIQIIHYTLPVVFRSVSRTIK